MEILNLYTTPSRFKRVSPPSGATTVSRETVTSFKVWLCLRIVYLLPLSQISGLSPGPPDRYTILPFPYCSHPSAFLDILIEHAASIFPKQPGPHFYHRIPL